MRSETIKSALKYICLTTGLLCSTSAFAQAGPWIVTEKTGDVFVGQSGITKVAIKGNSLTEGDSVKTGKTGRAVITRGEQFMVISPNSHIRIANPKDDGYLTQIIEYFGSVLFNVDKKKDKHFEVKTPYMAAVVKGTTFNIVVGPEGSTVQVTEGAVEVATLDGGARELLTPGNIGLVESSDPFSLNIIGDTDKRIDSPNRVATEGTVTASRKKAVAAQPPIVREIANAPANLGELTNGLIVGETSKSNRQVQISRSRANDNKHNIAITSESVDRSNRGNNISSRTGNGNAGGNGNGNAGGNGNGNAALMQQKSFCTNHLKGHLNRVGLA